MAIKKNSVNNPNALKLLINEELIDTLALGLFELNIDDVSIKLFKSLRHQLINLELKERILLISKKLNEILGDKNRVNYLALYLKDSRYHEKIASLQWWPISDLVESYSLIDNKNSLPYLLLLTEVFTSEFAVRTLLNQEQELVLDFLLAASQSKNVHHRRFSSEGSRPLLPWGKKAINIAKNPKLTEKILDNLKYDEELYVRKSVANHLNDFSKSHPEFVLKTLESWNKNVAKKHREKIVWITKHALRTLIKQGNAKALELVNGKLSTNLKLNSIAVKKKKIKVGDKLEISIELTNQTKKDERYVLEYVIGFKLKTGKIGYKTFKGTSGLVRAGEKVSWKKSHSFKVITTRTFYSGIHELKFQLNGKESDALKFILLF